MGRGYFALGNGTWWSSLCCGCNPKKKQTIRILAVVTVRGMLRWPMGHGGAGCGKIINKRFHGNIDCGVGKKHSASAKDMAELVMK